MSSVRRSFVALVAIHLIVLGVMTAVHDVVHSALDPHCGLCMHADRTGDAVPPAADPFVVTPPQFEVPAAKRAVPAAAVAASPFLARGPPQL